MEQSALQRHVTRNRDRELFLKEYEQAHARLLEDPAASAEIEAERSAFDGTLMDGLEDEPV
jgi:hypothetical protein